MSSKNKGKAQAYRQTEAYKFSRRMYNMKPEVQERRRIKRAIKKRLSG